LRRGEEKLKIGKKKGDLAIPGTALLEETVPKQTKPGYLQ
jgi:hypothetical protein